VCRNVQTTAFIMDGAQPNADAGSHDTEFSSYVFMSGPSNSHSFVCNNK
jgi:hypothetical protein